MVHAAVTQLPTPPTVPSGGVGEYLAYDSILGEIYSTNGESANTVSVISDSSNTVVATVTVGVDPVDIAYDAGKGEMFVINDENPASSGLNSTVSVIQDSSNTVVATIMPRRGRPDGHSL